MHDRTSIYCGITFIGLLILCVGGAAAASDSAQMTIGYVYPAGAQRGQTVQVIAAGQNLRGIKDVFVSGEGVHAKVIHGMREIQNINSDQRKEINRLFYDIRDKRLAELPPKLLKEVLPQGLNQKTKARDKKNDANAAPVKLPKNIWIDTLQEQSLRQLAHTAYMIYFPRTMLQVNRQLSEQILIEVTVDADAKPGCRELRLLSNYGVSNPIVFQVGTLPEVRELEPNNDIPYYVSKMFKPISTANLQKILKRKPFGTPVVINGQIMPGDIDRFRFRAKAGQKLVIEVSARSLIPYLADAVPGWFQTVVTLYNAAGTKLAFADDYRFSPDPVLFYNIPRDGFYEIEIRDAIYRGRKDFVYRIAIGERPFITQMYPLGGKAGAKTTASIDGWNLSKKHLKLDTRPGGKPFRRTACEDGGGISNAVPYEVSTLPECKEIESNDTLETAQKIDLPNIVNGRILTPEDVDVFEFTGKAGEKIAAEVYARRLNSPLDSLLQLTDASGKVLQWNDDYVQKEHYLHIDRVGLQTHHADSYWVAELPEDGIYYVHLSDTEHHGSAAHSYRLRIAQARGDFSLRITPSGLSIPAGATVPVKVYALRKDSFGGPIEIDVKNPDSGFTISGGVIPAGSDSVPMTLTAPAAPGKKVRGRVPLELEGRAEIGGKTIIRPVEPADDKMQAFLYRHLVPAQEFCVFVQKAQWPTLSIKRDASDPVQLPAGGSVQVRLKTPRRPTLNGIGLELYNPPAGITLHDVSITQGELAFVLKADRETVKCPFSSNLIIQVFREFTPPQKKGKPAPKKQRKPLGFLPAIGIQIISESGSNMGDNCGNSDGIVMPGLTRRPGAR